MLCATSAGESLRLDFSSTAALRLKEQAEARKVRRTIRRCAAPPAIDGVLDDAAWKNAASVRLPGRPPTTVRFCFDDAALYIGVVCQEAQGYERQAGAHPRDAGAWRDDCLEIYFLPPSMRPVLHQFVLSAANAINDERDGVSAYNPEWAHAIGLVKNGWTAEMAFPYEALGLSGPVNKISFNMHRTGPHLALRSWARPERDAGAGCLVLEGVTAQGVQAVEASAERSPFVATQGEALDVQFESLELEPGERWLPVELNLRPRGPLAQAKVHAKLFRLDRADPVDAVSVVPDRVHGTLKADLVSQKLDTARLSVRLMEGTSCTGAADLLLRRKPCPRPMKPGERVPVVLDFPRGMAAADAWPVTFGLPFPAGTLWEPKTGPLPIRLVDEHGAEIPFQAEVTARWAPEGSVKWLRIDALVTPESRCYVESGAAPGKLKTTLQLTQKEDAVIVETGPARFVLGRGASPIREIWRGDRLIATSEGARGLYLVDQKGRLGKASADDEQMEVEARGPVAACVRFEGWYTAADGQNLARHITRVEAFAGQAFLRVTHTLVLTEDTNKVWFKDLGWELAVEPGASPEAVFGLGPPATDFRKAATVPLQGGARSAYMLQDSHYRFAHGTNHYTVAAVGADGKEAKRAEGEECGDWAALRGKAGCLLIGCRDTARQHPKEFEILRDRVVLHLFSNRADEELDYRTTTLMKRWHLPDWIKLQNQKGGRVARYDEKEFTGQIASYVNDASGGARTHDLLFAALDPSAQTESLARLGGLHGAPVYALPDPQWTYETRVLGPNYPRDMERFPEAEKAVRAALQFYLDCDAAWGEHGFIDYFAGPHGSLYMDDKVPVLYRYIEFTYFFRAQIWLLYARSGDRAIRYFAEGTNRAHLDNRFAHWGDKTGYYRLAHGTANCVPLYRHKGYRLLELGELLDNFIWHYYLTGDRRMKDGLLECAEAYKAGWSERRVLHDWTKNSILQHCMQLYAFTGDEEFRAMGDRTLDLITDPQNGILLTKRAYESSTYKTHQAIRSLTTAYRLRPTPRLLDLCTRVSQWLQEYPYSPFGYTRPGSVAGSFLYDLTSDPAQAQSLAVAVRNIGGVYDPTTGKVAEEMHSKVNDFAPGTPFLFDIGYALHPLAEAGLDKIPNAASWLCYTDDLGTARPIVRKNVDEVIRLHYQAAGVPAIRMLDTSVNQVSQGDASVISLRQENALRPKGEILLPKDAPAGDYIVQFPSRGQAALFASSRAKMVLYAPDYWMPGDVATPPDRQSPPFRYYFSVPKETGLPKDAPHGQIFFAAPAQLYNPQGKPWPKDEPVQDWVDLPSNKPGLWSFAVLRQGMIRTRNIPPFFAFNDPQAYFEPAVLDWKSEAPLEEPPLRADSLYVPGPSHCDGDQALYLSGRKYFQIDPPKGAGVEFFPNREGTLEFFIRPNWNFFDLKQGETRGLLWGGGGLYLDQRVGALLFSWNMDGKIPKVSFGGRRNGPSMLLRDRWTHVAVVWGPSRTAEVIWGQYGAKSITSQTRQKRMNLIIYVNGKKSPQGYNNHPVPAEGEFFLPIRTLVVGGVGHKNRLDAAIDNLRLSDVQRYWEDFTPPPRECEFTVDPHTRALFLFNGNLEGRGHVLKDPLVGVVKE